MTQLGQGINLVDAITGSWLSMPSAVSTLQSPRLMLISDVVMAPFGLGVKLKSVAPSPWQGAIEINSFWGRAADRRRTVVVRPDHRRILSARRCTQTSCSET